MIMFVLRAELLLVLLCRQALSVPGGKTSAGLPVGVQLIGPRLKEEVVLHVGSKLF
jgi:Asp-tRNA(Asn)/Glu-tRNA(Gln) amidotransferase A subunit family amidase